MLWEFNFKLTITFLLTEVIIAFTEDFLKGTWVLGLGFSLLEEEWWRKHVIF